MSTIMLNTSFRTDEHRNRCNICFGKLVPISPKKAAFKYTIVKIHKFNSHYFHEQCIRTWVRVTQNIPQRDLCPQCTLPMTNVEFYKPTKKKYVKVELPPLLNNCGPNRENTVRANVRQLRTFIREHPCLSIGVGIYASFGIATIIIHCLIAHEMLQRLTPRH